MEIRDIIELIVTVVGSFGLVAFGYGYWKYKTREGKDGAKHDILASAEQLTQFWKEQAEGYKLMMQEKEEKMQTQIHELTKQVGELRGQLNEKTTQYEKLERIFQSRDPEQVEFRKTMLLVAEQSQKFMADTYQGQKDTHGIMVEIKEFMQHINDRLEAIDQDIDIKATVSRKEHDHA